MLAKHGLDPTRLQRFVARADVVSRQSDGTTIAA
jgi:phage terminase large subunit